MSEFRVVAFAEVIFEHAAHTVEQTDGGKFGDDKVVDVHAETFLRHFFKEDLHNSKFVIY